jgi:hypothetical protein
MIKPYSTMETAIYLSSAAAQLVREIDEAEKSILLAAPGNSVLYDLLLGKAKQGLEIQFFIKGESEVRDNQGDFAELVAAGIKVYPSGHSGGVEGNFVVIDNSIVILGYDEINLTVIKGNEEVAGRFLAEFERLKTLYNQRLQWLITCLETEIPALENEKSAMEKTISDFNHAYNRVFGDTILKILTLKKERLRKQDNTGQSPRYKQAAAEHKTFSEAVSEAQKEELPHLDTDQKVALKTQYRKAVQLCHPDRFLDEETKSRAHVIFLELQEAYTKDRLDEVTEILERLENGALTAINELIQLRTADLEKRLQYLTTRREELLQEIVRLRNDRSYKEIIVIENMDKFYKEEESRLLNILQQLQHE